MATKEIVVIGENPHARGTLHEPVSDRLRPADLGSERPAMGTDVDELLRIVFAGWCCDHDTHTERSCRLAPRKLGRCESGATD